MKVKCPQCKVECDMAEDLLARLGDWKCAACWHEALANNERLLSRLRRQGGARGLIDAEVRPVEKFT